MTAFAAILSANGSTASDRDVTAVGAALAASTGRPTRDATCGACTLLLSPLHRWDPPAPVRDQRSSTIAVGQVMLEGGGDLSTVARAYVDAGPRCTRNMSGEYAFAIWDAREQRLVCARDGLGIRVAYVAEAAGVVVVTNVLEAALAHRSVPCDFEARSLVAFLASGEPAWAGRTPYRAICLIPEGHTLVISRGRASLERHWFFPQPQALRTRNEHDIVDGYRAVLRHAIDDRLGAAGATIFLSGGIDSTTVAAAATDRTKLRAVTVEYARTPDNDDPQLARTAAQRLAIPIDIVPGDRFEALDEDPVSRPPALPVDEPALADWRAMMRPAARYASVAIHGEDGDALFRPPGGRELLRAQSLIDVFVASTRHAVRTKTLPYFGVRLRERIGIERRPATAPPAWLRPDARRLLEPTEPDTVLGQSPTPLPPHPTRSATQERLIRNVPTGFALTLAPDVLREPIEVRLPLMDSRVLAFVASVPPIPWCQSKHLARAAFDDDLPADIVRRRKTPVHGFYEALVETWRRNRLPRLALDLRCSRLADWIDVPHWTNTLHAGTSLDVVAAWRVLLLNRWLETCTR